MTLVKVQAPLWPVSQQTTYELRDYRTELEHAIERTPEHAAEREILRVQLTEVLDEQASRAAAERRPS